MCVRNDKRLHRTIISQFLLLDIFRISSVSGTIFDVPGVINVKNLVKQYKKSDRKAVNDISFNVEEGELFTLLGPNGAGKTTTISILTTTLAKTSGEIIIHGYNIDIDPKSVRQQIGIIFQQPSLDLNLTAEENVRFHTILYGLYPFRPSYSMMPTSYKNKINELAEILEIKDEMFKPIKTFSGGMKRKLEIIRGLMHEPRVLFLDEPTTGLDPASRKTLWTYMQQIRKEKKITIFLTTHYLDEAEEADRVCILHHGKIITIGTPRKIKQDLIENYLLVDTEDKNKLFAELHNHNLRFEDGELVKVFIHDLSVQEIIQSIQTPLTTLETHIPTIEEAYLSIVAEEDKHETGN
ncbi:ATP-binding cassette domain-containing protein [candidate division WWE3 bacterium]|uniref:ATP-binding cassette domain-containing protein n=1 Tax=candidate division WWE3 bacterium TaxID=2053526 RepID=A0A955LGU5_UNCKA|nr:ATP-binding cassette domain-containing protein [candidate division WWE3 bacterium]